MEREGWQIRRRFNDGRKRRRFAPLCAWHDTSLDRQRWRFKKRKKEAFQINPKINIHFFSTVKLSQVFFPSRPFFSLLDSLFPLFTILNLFNQFTSLSLSPLAIDFNRFSFFLSRISSYSILLFWFSRIFYFFLQGLFFVFGQHFNIRWTLTHPSHVSATAKNTRCCWNYQCFWNKFQSKTNLIHSGKIGMSFFLL